MATANNTSNRVDPGRPIADLLSEFPQLAEIFIQKRMYCVGCSMSSFDTIYDVISIYGLNLDTFLNELSDRLESGSKPADKR